jgi:hypothetical protein
VRQAKLDFDNLQSEREYKPIFGTYAQSKLADLIFAFELQRRLTRAGSPIVSAAAHPGVAGTNLLANLSGVLKLLAPVVTPIIGQTAARGALPVLFAATSPDVVPGGYYGPNSRSERTGYPCPARIPTAAIDAMVAERMWAETERLTGVNFQPVQHASTP